MTPALFAALLLSAPAANAGPSEAQLSRALAGLSGETPQVASVQCQPSAPGYVRCTYLLMKHPGYTRWAVLVSEHEGRWTVSEGPIREKPKSVKRSPRG